MFSLWANTAINEMMKWLTLRLFRRKGLHKVSAKLYNDMICKKLRIFSALNNLMIN